MDFDSVFVDKTIALIYLFRAGYPELIRLVSKVLRIVLGWDLLHCRWLKIVIPSLLLSKMNGILLTPERHPCSLHVIRRARPAHQWILPPTRSLQDIPVNTPTFALRSTALHGVPCGLVNTHGAVMQLGWSTTDSVCDHDFPLWRSCDLRRLFLLRIPRLNRRDGCCGICPGAYSYGSDNSTFG